MPRSKAHNKLLQILVDLSVGDKVQQDELCQRMGWTHNTLRTYESKGMLSPFLSQMSDGSFEVLKNGSTISLAEIQESFSQSKPKEFVPRKGLRLRNRMRVYELRRDIGAGAVGHVWEAARVSPAGDPVAVKIMLPREDLLEPTMIANVRKRFKREAANGIQLQDPRVIEYIDTGDHSGHPFLVMELAKASIRQRLSEASVFSVSDSTEVVRACVEGLQFLHEKDCIHRDIKPENILETDRGYVLGDLGIVRWADFSSAFTSAGSLTHASVQLGSWFYMAPEQLDDPHAVTPACDVYALAVTWYEMLTNDKPSPQKISAKRYAPPSEDDKVNRLIGDMLNYAPEDRPGLETIMQRMSKH